MKITKIFIVLVILFGLLAVPGKVYAKSIDLPVMDDRVIFGGSFTLESGETQDGSLIVLGGVVLLEEGSFVEGDVVVFGGNLSVEGEVQQNIVAIGGVLSLANTAVVYGDLVAPATVFKREEGAQVYGQVITDTVPLDIEIPDVPDIPDIPDVPDIPNIPDIPDVPDFEFRTYPFVFFDQISYALSPLTNVLWFMVRVFAFSTVAILVVLFVPEHMRRTSNAVYSYPILSGGLGLLSVIVAIPIMIVFTIMIILIPGTILISILLSLGLFFGWIAIGLEVGRRISESINRDWSIPVQAGVGTFALTFVIGSFGFILWEWVSVMLMIAVCSVGLGAVLLTRFGVREYVPSDSPQVESADPIPQKKTEQAEKHTSEKKPVPKAKSKTKTSTKQKKTTKDKSDK
jgi:hypothetical protein